MNLLIYFRICCCLIGELFGATTHTKERNTDTAYFFDVVAILMQTRKSIIIDVEMQQRKKKTTSKFTWHTQSGNSEEERKMLDFTGVFAKYCCIHGANTVKLNTANGEFLCFSSSVFGFFGSLLSLVFHEENRFYIAQVVFLHTIVRQYCSNTNEDVVDDEIYCIRFTRRTKHFSIYQTLFGNYAFFFLFCVAFIFSHSTFNFDR